MAKSVEENILDNLLCLRDGMLAKLSCLDADIERQRGVVLKQRDARLREEMGLLPDGGNKSV